MKCTLCDQEFEIKKGEKMCPNGGDRHQVISKTYYMDDAPADPGPFIATSHGFQATGENRKHARTILANLVPEQRIVVDGQATVVPGREVIFVRGIYSTTDAEEQFYLDRREEAGQLCTKERWETVYLTDGQRLELKKLDLDAREQRLEQDKRGLLGKVKQQAQAPRVAEDPNALKDQIPA